MSFIFSLPFTILSHITEEMNALNVLKNAMEKRVEANRKLNEQLERTSRELTEAKEELKLTREKIEGTA